MNNSEQHRFECECRHWLTLMSQHRREPAWWPDMLDRLRRQRGQAAVQRLLDGINQQRNRRK